MSEGKNARDTQFAGFAKALRKELVDLYHDQWQNRSGVMSEEIVNSEIDQLLARRAYDLVKHAAMEVILEVEGNCIEMAHRVPDDEIIAMIPDLPDLPKEQE